MLWNDLPHGSIRAAILYLSIRATKQCLYVGNPDEKATKGNKNCFCLRKIANNNLLCNSKCWNQNHLISAKPSSKSGISQRPLCYSPFLRATDSN